MGASYLQSFSILGIELVTNVHWSQCDGITAKVVLLSFHYDWLLIEERLKVKYKINQQKIND